MTMGKKICELRKAHGMSQEQLAEALDVSRQAVSKWENDLSEPSSKKKVQLAKIFNISLDQLMHPKARVVLICDVRKDVSGMKENKKLFIFIGIFLALFLACFAVAVYGRVSGNFSEPTVFMMIMASVVLMLCAFLPVLFTILRFVYLDCRARGIRPTFWVVISTTAIGLVYFLLRRELDRER